MKKLTQLSNLFAGIESCIETDKFDQQIGADSIKGPP